MKPTTSTHHHTDVQLFLFFYFFLTNNNHKKIREGRTWHTIWLEVVGWWVVVGFFEIHRNSKKKIIFLQKIEKKL
jgi:hypothetical protein